VEVANGPCPLVDFSSSSDPSWLTVEVQKRCREVGDAAGDVGIKSSDSDVVMIGILAT
jgi:hypothetical protein